MSDSIEESKKDSPTIIKKNKYGFLSDLNFIDIVKDDKGLVVITGLNGVGKSNLLKEIRDYYNSESFKAKKQVPFYKSPLSMATANSSYDNRYIPGRMVVKDVESFLTSWVNGSENGVDNKADIFNVLFNENDINYEERENVINASEKIINSIKNIDAKERSKLFKEKLYVFDDEKTNEFAFKYFKNLVRSLINEQLGKEIKINVKSRHEELNSLFKKWDTQDVTYNDVNIPKKTTIHTKNIQEKLKESIKPIESEEQLIEEIENFFSFNIEIQELANLIVEQNKGKYTILIDFNENYLKKYGFPFTLKDPNKGIKYEFIFKDGKNNLHIDKLSTGEYMLFQFICFLYLKERQDEEVNNNKISVFILDEFDSFLNPDFIKKYFTIFKVLGESIKIILTTHNPYTASKVEPKELYELIKDDKEMKLECAENDKGKFNILDKLAPNFLHQDDSGVFVLPISKFANNVIIVEGESDKKYLDKMLKVLKLEKQYSIINVGVFHIDGKGGASKIKPYIEMLRHDMFKPIMENKKIIALADFDNEGFTKCYCPLKTNEIVSNRYYDKVKNSNEDKTYVMLLLPLDKNNDVDYLNFNTTSTDKSFKIENMFTEVCDKLSNQKDKKAIEKIIDANENLYHDEQVKARFKKLFDFMDKIEDKIKEQDVK